MAALLTALPAAESASQDRGFRGHAGHGQRGFVGPRGAPGFAGARPLAAAPFRQQRFAMAAPPAGFAQPFRRPAFAPAPIARGPFVGPAPVRPMSFAPRIIHRSSPSFVVLAPGFAPPPVAIVPVPVPVVPIAPVIGPYYGQPRALVPLPTYLAPADPVVVPVPVPPVAAAPLEAPVDLPASPPLGALVAPPAGVPLAPGTMVPGADGIAMPAVPPGAVGVGPLASLAPLPPPPKPARFTITTYTGNLGPDLPLKLDLEAAATADAEALVTYLRQAVALDKTLGEHGCKLAADGIDGTPWEQWRTTPVFTSLGEGQGNLYWVRVSAEDGNGGEKRCIAYRQAAKPGAPAQGVRDDIADVLSALVALGATPELALEPVASVEEIREGPKPAPTDLL